MAVVVEVISVYPPSDPPPGTRVTGSLQISVTGDYECRVPVQFQTSVQFQDEPSRQAAIANALHKVAKAAEQILAGANEAAINHPIGG